MRGDRHARRALRVCRNALAEERLAFTRIDIDLGKKPDGFLALSPLSKTPVLSVGEVTVFEPAVVLEYLVDTATLALHPSDPLERAAQCGWIDMVSAVMNDIGALYSAPDERAFRDRPAVLRRRFEAVEARLSAGLRFKGNAFSPVDATFAPLFCFFDGFDHRGDLGNFGGLTPGACRTTFGAQGCASGLPGTAGGRPACAALVPR